MFEIYTVLYKTTQHNGSTIYGSFSGDSSAASSYTASDMHYHKDELVASNQPDLRSHLYANEQRTQRRRSKCSRSAGTVKSNIRSSNMQQGIRVVCDLSEIIEGGRYDVVPG